MKIDSGKKIKVDSTLKSYSSATVEEGSSKSKKIISIVVGCVAIIGAVVAAFKVYTDYQFKSTVNAVALSADDIDNEIVSVLNSQAPTTWVYDRDENLIMTLKLSDILQSVEVVPDVIKQAILKDCQGDLTGFVVKDYIAKSSLPAEEEVYLGYCKRVEAVFTQDDLIRYLAISSNYGEGYKGIVNASNVYFGQIVSKLNDTQLEFLANLYRNNLDIDKYLRENNLTEEKLGLIFRKSGYASIRSKIVEELKAVKGVDLMSKNYMVKLTISTQQQSILQSIIDNDMRELIDLNSDNTFAFDCSIVVVDRVTGYVRAFVPSRSASSVNSNSFAMNIQSFRNNYKELYKLLSDENTFGFTLKEIKKANGDKELKSIKELFESMNLADANPQDLVDAITLLKFMYSANESSKGINMLYQITDSSGMTLYKASGNSNVDIGNNNLCQFFSDNNDLTRYGATIKLDTGYISFQSTADYILLALGGSSALGGSMTTNQDNVISKTIDELKTTVATFYPTPTVPVWNGAGMNTAMETAYNYNRDFIEKIIREDLDNLNSQTVNSVDSRISFEKEYERIKTFIKDYTEFIGSGYANSLYDALEQVRMAKTLDLIKYSVK